MMSELGAFVGRYNAIRKFVEYVNSGGLPNSTITFYGDGYFGKTLLRKFLQEYCVKQIGQTELTALCAREDEDFITALRLVDNPASIPYASIDFASTRVNFHDTYEGLHNLYRSLKKTYREDFPLFAYACLNLLVSERELSEEDARKAFGPSLYDKIRDLFEGPLVSPEIGQGGELSVKFELKNLANMLIGTVVIGAKRLQSGLKNLFNPDDAQKDWLSKIATLGPEDLRKELPRFFALDLLSILARKGEPKRAVLFFDSFEAPYSNDRDHWLARLAQELRESERMLIVLIGRKVSAWMNGSELCYIGPLSARDAERMIQGAGVSDTKVGELMIDCASLQTDQIDPYYLSLCIDRAKKSGRIELSRADFQDLYGESLDMRLRFETADVKKAIIALSSCRQFDREIYDMLGERLGFSHSLEEFEDLCNRPLATRAANDDSFRIETGLRNLVVNSNKLAAREAHRALEVYYTRRLNDGDRLAVLSSVYHANRKDAESWERGLEVWEGAFKAALKESKYDLCSLLIQLTKSPEPDNVVIKNDSWRGKLIIAEAIYYAHLSETRTARRLATKARRLFAHHTPADGEAEIYVYEGLALISIGEMLPREKDQRSRATCCYELAQGAFDKALKELPCKALTGKARALIDLAALRETAAESEVARETYETAILVCDEVLDSYYGCDESNVVEASLLKGRSLQGLGRLRQKREDFQSALSFYNDAMQAYETPLIRGTDNAEIFIRMASANIWAAEVCAGRSANAIAGAQGQDAESEEIAHFYRQALAACDSARKYASRSVDANVKQAIAHLRLGKLFAGSREHESAGEEYEQAISASRVALETAPKNVEAFQIRAEALLRLGQSRDFHDELVKAERSYAQAITVCGEALPLAPDNSDLYAVRATAHLSLGELWLRLKPTQDRTKSYDQAVSDYDEALRLSSDDDRLLANRAFALSRRIQDN